MNPSTENDCNKDSTTATRSTTPEDNPTINDVRKGVAIAALNLQIPDFWPDQPRSWFAQFEAFMSLQNQDDKSKYHLVISKLNKEAIQAVSDIVFNPPRNGKYEALKYRLLNVFDVSQEKKMEKLLKELEASKITRLMANNLSEQNDLLKRIERLLIYLCEMYKLDNGSNCYSGSEGRSSRQGWLCWYHRRFGIHSYKCGDENRCTFNECC